MQKLNTQKYIRNIDDNVVQGRLSENYLTRKIIAQNIRDLWYMDTGAKRKQISDQDISA